MRICAILERFCQKGKERNFYVDKTGEMSYNNKSAIFRAKRRNYGRKLHARLFELF